MRSFSSDLDIRPEIITRVVENLLKLTPHGNRTTIDVLAEQSIVSKDVAFEIVSRLLGKDFNENEVEVTGDVRLSIVLECIKNGAPAEILARHVSWKDFEALSARILGEFGFNILKNLRLRLSKKRCEIDILATKDSMVLLLDCKRWNAILAGKRLSLITKNQLRRAWMFAEYLSSVFGEGDVIVEIIPAVLALYGSSEWIESGVAIIPVGLLRNFIERLPEIKYDLERIKVRGGSTLKMLFDQQKKETAPQ
ncbi:MAG: nuclease-related domain-containing protein [Nitrososphaerota archaeon]|nr:NERD domain-containing protein [Aigarchaeota archaeon]MDW8076508.1 nuclease-related domain-containing protein [Nitrososphaerota archaeon]